jgi:hypothetical protein
MIRKIRKPYLAVCIAIYLLCLFSSPAVAGMIGSVFSPEVSSDQRVRGTEISKIQRALETEIVKEKLNAYDLTPDEINVKLHDLSDEQIHMLAQASDQILAGGDGGEVVIAVLLIVLIVLLILYLTNKHVVVR